MRAFFKLHRSKGLEAYLTKANADNDVRYSHVSANLPSVVVHPMHAAKESEQRMFQRAGSGQVMQMGPAPTTNKTNVTYNVHEQ